jgi:hypothetical protein
MLTPGHLDASRIQHTRGSETKDGRRSTCLEFDLRDARGELTARIVTVSRTEDKPMASQVAKQDTITTRQHSTEE